MELIYHSIGIIHRMRRNLILIEWTCHKTFPGNPFPSTTDDAHWSALFVLYYGNSISRVQESFFNRQTLCILPFTIINPRLGFTEKQSVISLSVNASPILVWPLIQQQLLNGTAIECRTFICHERIQRGFRSVHRSLSFCHHHLSSSGHLSDSSWWSCLPEACSSPKLKSLQTNSFRAPFHLSACAVIAAAAFILIIHDGGG